MKKLLFLLTSMVMLVGTTVSAKDISVELNGSAISFDQPPIIQNDRTLVPMRAIFEAMGCDVIWYEENQEIDVWKGDINVITMWVNDYNMWTYGDEYIELDVAPQIVNGRTLVPVRAISESVGAYVNWDGRTMTVSITFNDAGVCDCSDYTVTSTSDEWNEYEEFDDTYHYEHEWNQIRCNDCGEYSFEFIQTNKKTHQFVNGVCKQCGYVKKSTPIPTVKPTATPRPTEKPQQTLAPSVAVSDKISDYVDGAFRCIVVPPSRSIKIPNTSNGTLKIQMDGVYNSMEIKKDGKIQSNLYNDKDKKSSVSISKGSQAVIQNSGTVDMVVSIPADYTQYSETNEKAYETIYLDTGETIELYAPSGDNIYFDNSKFEYLKYEQSDNEIYQVSPKGIINKYLSLSKGCVYRITAINDMEIYYCPSTVTWSKTGEPCFKNLVIGSGETIRIYATKESRTFIYTDNEHRFDYVTYTNDGKVSSQKQNYKANNLTVGRSFYTDFTNITDETVTIRIPNINVKTENR